jgi:L-asparaginase/Glu-tRNA(Gln) amidotransferase subunit D
MTQPHLILTGGTICMSRNPDTKLLGPDGESLDAFIRKSFDHPKITKAYNIDSIDFDIAEHYPKLLQAAKAALTAGDVPIVCGGTDSMAWYSTLLTKDLQREGFLTPGSKQKILFLSSISQRNHGRLYRRRSFQRG